MNSNQDTPDAAEVSAVRSGLGGVVGVALGLAALAACTLALFFYGTASLAAESTLREKFELRPMPFEFTLEQEAHVLPGGERVFRFGDASQPATLDVDAVVEPSSSSDDETVVQDPKHDSETESSDEARSEFDWSTIEVLSTNGPPQQLFLVNYPSARAESVLAEQFRSLNWKDLRFIEAKGGRSAVDGGKLTWDEYAADFVRERTYIEGGAFRDTMRVNLSLGRECWIAYAIWPKQHAGSTEPVRELLDCIRPLTRKRTAN